MGSFGWIFIPSKVGFIHSNIIVNESQVIDSFSSNQTDTDRFPSRVFLEEEKEVEDECSFVPFEVNRVSTKPQLTFTFLSCQQGKIVEENRFPLPVPIWLAKRCLLL
jgi:hypothetical protein